MLGAPPAAPERGALPDIPAASELADPAPAPFPAAPLGPEASAGSDPSLEPGSALAPSACVRARLRSDVDGSSVLELGSGPIDVQAAKDASMNAWSPRGCMTNQLRLLEVAALGLDKSAVRAVAVALHVGSGARSAFYLMTPKSD